MKGYCLRTLYGVVHIYFINNKMLKWINYIALLLTVSTDMKHLGLHSLDQVHSCSGKE